MSFYLGLVHYPIVNKRGQKVSTSVTNLDIHDIARSCKTFGIKRYFIVTPIDLQRELVNDILGHWGEDTANDYNPDRANALSIAQTVSSIEDALFSIEKIEKKRPLVVVTGANFSENCLSVLELTKRLEKENMPCLILFGTGWGLHEEALSLADVKLEPILSIANDYNHLSVRSAVAIYLDRLFGKK